MTPNAYEDALNQAKADMIRAIKQRDHWTMEVARLQQVISSLSVMTEKRGTMAMLRDALADPEIGLQEIVYTCVRDASPQPMTAIQIRDQISIGRLADLSRNANPLAVIHGALKRLAAQHKIREMPDGSYRMPAIYEGLIALQKTSKK